MAAGPGRKAFAGLGPPNARIRMMEPGEAPALLALTHPEGAASCRSLPRELDRFVRFLVEREAVVAAARPGGAPLGFAAARAAAELYWLSGLAVAPEARGRGLGSALLEAVTRRARWFFHRALALGLDESEGRAAAALRRRGFLHVSGKDVPPILLDRLDEDAAAAGSLPMRHVFVKWL